MGVMVSGVGMYDYVYIYENYDIIKSIMNKYEVRVKHHEVRVLDYIQVGLAYLPFFYII